MSLKALLRAGKELLKAKKPSATPTTGQATKQITYTPKPSQAQGQELAIREIKNPPVVLKKTKPLQMGDDMGPAFGSSTYDWAMRMGRSKYTADEWLNHLTSTRKITFKLFGKPATKTIREQKRFKYDSGPFAGKEVNISKEELFDSNLALFNEAGDLTGGLLYAAKKFGIKLDANEIGAMIKLNPINRLKPIEFGTAPGAKTAFDKAYTTARNTVQDLQVKYKGQEHLKESLDDVQYYLNAAGRTGSKSAINDVNSAMKRLSDTIPKNERIVLNKSIGDLNTKAAPLQKSQTQYGTESNYTLQGGKDYRETVFALSEDITTNSTLRNKGGHFTNEIGDVNNIYHIRFDVRFTPQGKKVYMINEIQSDVNQSIAKSLTKAQQLSGETRLNPFNADIELNLLISQRGKMLRDIDQAIANNEFGRVNAISASMKDINKKLSRHTTQRNMYGNEGGKDYFPMVEADSYGDHAVKYLMQKAARDNVDYIAVAPFDKLSFRQGYKAGNERFYGYANGKGIGKKGKAVLPDVMNRNARFYGSQAGPTKISLSDPTKRYKDVGKDTFKYPSDHPLKGKEIKSSYHSEAVDSPLKGFKNIPEGDPRLYFDAYALKVVPLMRNTQKTYKSKGGLVVDMFKSIRYN